VSHEVTNVGNDRELSNMATAARGAMGRLQALADPGDFNGTELKACEDAGITTYVPKPMTSNAKAEGRFDKSDFIYIAKDDERAGAHVAAAPAAAQSSDYVSSRGVAFKQLQAGRRRPHGSLQAAGRRRFEQSCKKSRYAENRQRAPWPAEQRSGSQEDVGEVGLVLARVQTSGPVTELPQEGMAYPQALVINSSIASVICYPRSARESTTTPS
jgi:hypothetical protein